MTPASMSALISEMRALSHELSPGRRAFHDTYLRTTEAIDVALAAGRFVDAAWVEEWDLAFAGRYLDALTTDMAGERPSRPWQAAFAASDGPRLPPLRLVLLGMNAHINYDLPQAVCAVVEDDDWHDPDLIGRRAADHARIDAILAERVATEDRLLEEVEQPGDRTWLDRLLRPINRLGTRRFLAESRAKVWTNARLLSEARRTGRETELLLRLEDRSTQRVHDLTRPRQVILELAIRGFGVSLEET